MRYRLYINLCIWLENEKIIYSEYKKYDEDYDFLLDVAKQANECVKFILLGNARKGEGPMFLKKRGRWTYRIEK